MELVMKRFIRSKKGITLITLVVAAAVAAAAWAYFTGNGSGTGSAQTAGTPASLTISQIGAGYDSLVPNNVYHQDQCFQCAGISEFGNDITLHNSGAQSLVSVAVAFRNWGNAITGLPITLSINNTPNGPITETQNFDFPAATTVGSDPSTKTVTFNFHGLYVSQEFVYDISFDPSLDNAGGLNVALSSSQNNLSIGTDTDPGRVWVNTTAGAGIAGDFPSCTTPGSGFAEVQTNCGPASLGNPGAYGTNAQVAAGNADIPAVEFNVVGGTITGLTPGGPAQPVDFAITNPGSSGVFVNQVTTSITGLTGGGSFGGPPPEACATSMYQVNNASRTYGGVIAPGTTIWSPSGTTLQMNDDGNNQDNCEGATVNLGFSSN
jgi:hypothetical protein